MDPSRATFAEQVDHYAARAGLNNYKLSLAIGLLPGNVGFSAKQVERLRKGTQRPTTEGLVERLIEVFELTDEEADHLRFASGLIPNDWDFEAFRNAAQARRRRRNDREVDLATASSVSGQASSDLGDSTMGTWSHPAGSGVAGFAAA